MREEREREREREREFARALLDFEKSRCDARQITTRGHEALNRSPEYTGQSQTFNFEI